MTQDCSNLLSTADENKCFPKGINVIGTEKNSAPKVEGISKRERKKIEISENPTSWSYLFLQHLAVKTLQKWLDKFNSDDKNPKKQPYFIHQSYRYQYKNKETQDGVQKILEPSVSGLIFLQGSVRSLQAFLKECFPQYHLVRNCSTGHPASISDNIMQPFMNVVKTHPERITFLHDHFEKFAHDHVKLRVLTGPFKGYEGYIVRINRDRQLVFDFGGYAVAIRGVHKEDFEVVGEK